MEPNERPKAPRKCINVRDESKPVTDGRGERFASLICLSKKKKNTT